MSDINKKEIDEIENYLEKIKPGEQEFIGRRIKHKSFAKMIIWLDYQSRVTDFIYSTDLAKFLAVSRTRAYEILRELCSINLMLRKNEGAFAEFWFVNNDHTPKIRKYIEIARKTLDNY